MTKSEMDQAAHLSYVHFLLERAPFGEDVDIEGVQYRKVWRVLPTLTTSRCGECPIGGGNWDLGLRHPCHTRKPACRDLANNTGDIHPSGDTTVCTVVPVSAIPRLALKGQLL